jgi:pimeloyl-ACP methyl ester carboxylesterase
MALLEHGTSRIYYEEEGSGDPLLLIPGWSLSIEDLGPIRQALTQRYRVIAADPPGSGRSGPQPRKYAASYYEDDSRAFLALLEERRASPAHLVGFSDGGEYALLMAELKPAAARSIVAWGAAGQVAAPREFLEAFGQVVDNPIPPLQEFSKYLKGKYGEEDARIMAQTAAEAWGAIAAAVERTNAEPDLSVSATTLAPLFNGFLAPRGAALTGLAQARDEAALEAAERLFATRYPPFCDDPF